MNDKMDVCMLDQVSNHEKSLDKMLIKKIEEEKHTPFNLQRERERTLGLACKGSTWK